MASTRFLYTIHLRHNFQTSCCTCPPRALPVSLAIPKRGRSCLTRQFSMHNAAPVTGGGSDEVEMSRTGGLANANVSSRVAEREHTTRLWALLWRSIILSSLEKTYLPYCRYIQSLDLRDLVNLFEEQKFRGKIERFLSQAYSCLKALTKKGILFGRSGAIQK